MTPIFTIFAVLREEFRVMPRNSKVALGETATMTCTPPRGHPEPLVSWLHDGKHVETGVGRFKLNGNNLVISDVSLQDEGRYHCRAKNMLGERTSPPAILKVLGKPLLYRIYLFNSIYPAHCAHFTIVLINVNNLL